MILKPKSSNTKASSSSTIPSKNNNDVKSRATAAALHKAKQIMLAGGTQEEAERAAKNVARQILMEEMNTGGTTGTIDNSGRSQHTRGTNSSLGGSNGSGDKSRGCKSTSRLYNNGRIGQQRSSALTLSSNAASNATVGRLAMKNTTTTKSGGSGRAGGSSKGGKSGGLLSKFRNKRKNKKKSKDLDNNEQLPGIAEVSLDSDEGRDELSSSKNDYNNNNNGRDGRREESSPDTKVSQSDPINNEQQEDTVFKQFSNAADTVVELVEKLSGEGSPVVNNRGGENSSDFSSYDSSQDYYVPVEKKHVDSNNGRVDDGKNTEGINIEGKMEDLVNLNFVMNAVEKEIFPINPTQEKKGKHQKTFSSDDSKEVRASSGRENDGGGFLSQLCGALFCVEDGICSLGRGESQSFCSNTQNTSYEQQHQQKTKTSVLPSASLPSVSLDNSSRRHMDNANDIDGEISTSHNHHRKSVSWASWASWADSHNQRDDRYGLNIDNTNSTNDSSLIKAMARGMVNGSRSFIQSPPQAIETTFDGSTFETKDTYDTNKTSKGTNYSKSGIKISGGEQLINSVEGVDLISKNSGKGAESVSSKVKTILMAKNPFKSANQCIGGGGYQCGTSGYYIPPGGEEAGVEVFEGGENVNSNVNWRDMVQDTAPKDLDKGRSMTQQAGGGQYQASSGYQACPPMMSSSSQYVPNMQSQFQHPTPQETREYIQMHNPQVSNLPISSQGQQQVVAPQLPLVNREPSHIPKVNSNFSVESDDDRQDRYAGMPEEEDQHNAQQQPQPQHMVQMQDGHVMRSGLAYGDNTNTMAGQQRVEVVSNNPQPVAVTPGPTVTELVMSNTSLFSGLIEDSETGSTKQYVDRNGNGGQQGHRMQPARMQMPPRNKIPFNAQQQQHLASMQIPPFNPNKQRMMSNSNPQLNHQPPHCQQQNYHHQQQPVDVQTRDPASLNTRLNVMSLPPDYHMQPQQYHPPQNHQLPFDHGVDPTIGYYEQRNPQPVTSPQAYHGGYQTFAA